MEKISRFSFYCNFTLTREAFRVFKRLYDSHVGYRTATVKLVVDNIIIIVSLVLLKKYIKLSTFTSRIVLFARKRLI